MRLSEIFYSFQGEGIYCGQTSVFIRFFGCNLRCVYCDTPYSYDTSQEYRNLSPSEIIEEALAYNCRFVVITGGEPLLQSELDKVLRALKRVPRINITVETNCTIIRQELIDLVDLWSLSPKLKGSSQHFDEGILDSYLENTRTLQLKFVILDSDDLDQVKEILEKRQNRFALERIPIIFQPDGRLPNEEYLETWNALVEMVKNDRFLKQFDARVIPQLHRILYGNKRGI
ncbi:MAG: 7-carboxy-7-deazaguanine synthase QueE [Candidatus Odinarchaeota archaeon]